MVACRVSDTTRLEIRVRHATSYTKKTRRRKAVTGEIYRRKVEEGSANGSCWVDLLVKVGEEDEEIYRRKLFLVRRLKMKRGSHTQNEENAKVLEAERYSWAATRGVNEEMLLENLPEDLQREIRRHLFRFITKVRIFALMEEPILDAICERLRQKTYIKDSRILYRGGIIDKMVFIVRGKMQSIGEDNIVVPLSEGGVCGEELLTWCLEHSSDYRVGKKNRISAQRLQSNRIVRCLTNVEAFTLTAWDLEEVTSLFARFLRNPRVQGAIRYESPYWRCFAATRIQVAWRYRKKRLHRKETKGV